MISSRSVFYHYRDCCCISTTPKRSKRSEAVSEGMCVCELLESMIYELADHHIIDSALEDRFMNAIAGEWFAPVFQNKSPEDLYWISILLNTIAKYRQVSSDLIVLDRLMDDYADRLMDDNDQQLLAEYHAISDSMESLREYCRNPSAHLLE